MGNISRLEGNCCSLEGNLDHVPGKPYTFSGCVTEILLQNTPFPRTDSILFLDSKSDMHVCMYALLIIKDYVHKMCGYINQINAKMSRMPRVCSFVI